MFTGIVEEIGVVSELNPHDATGGTSLTIQLPSGSSLLADCHEGDSIAINGVCLTVVTFSHSTDGQQRPSFTVGIAPETLRLTNLGALTKNAHVNLERAVRADTRMGGHFVQGHVDATCTIVSITPDGNSLRFRFSPSTAASTTPATSQVLRYIVFKGYVALDGTSLTVTAVDDAEGWFEVMLIAYTQEKVVLAGKKLGDAVNVEVDMTAKYVEKSLTGYLDGLAGRIQGSEEAGKAPQGVAGLLEKMVERIVAQGFGMHG